MKSIIIVLWSLLLILGGTGAAFALTISDGFEGSSLNPFWTVEQLAYGQFSLSSDQAYSGSQSLKLNSLDGGQRYVYLAHDFGQAMQGTVSIWFYDGHPGQETFYVHFRVSNDTPALGATLGLQDWDPSYYHAGASFDPLPNEGQTTIARSLGWHKFEEIFESSGAGLFIDGQLVCSSSENLGFNKIEISLMGPAWRPNAEFYFDQFYADVHPVPLPPSLLLLGSGLLGLAGWRRFRKI
jgi:hypothetical protein